MAIRYNSALHFVSSKLEIEIVSGKVEITFALNLGFMNRVWHHELNPAQVHLSQKPSKMVFYNVERNFF